jgi:hypothetical protein
MPTSTAWSMEQFLHWWLPVPDKQKVTITRTRAHARTRTHTHSPCSGDIEKHCFLGRNILWASRNSEPLLGKGTSSISSGSKQNKKQPKSSSACRGLQPVLPCTLYPEGRHSIVLQNVRDLVNYMVLLHHSRQYSWHHVLLELQHCFQSSLAQKVPAICLLHRISNLTTIYATFPSKQFLWALAHFFQHS